MIRFMRSASRIASSLILTVRALRCFRLCFGILKARPRPHPAFGFECLDTRSIFGARSHADFLSEPNTFLIVRKILMSFPLLRSVPRLCRFPTWPR